MNDPFQTAGGDLVIDVRVVTRAARAGVAGLRDDALLVRLNAAPVEGAANQELVDLMASFLGVPRRSVTIVAGERSRQKKVRVKGVDAHRARQRLAESGRR